MREEIASTFTAAYGRQWHLREGHEPPVDTFTYQTRGRFSAGEACSLLEAVSEIVHPFGRAAEVAATATFEDAGLNHGWPSYRAALVAPTDGPIGLAISWRFTIPYRETVIDEIENLWVHKVGEPLIAPAPRPEREPITIGQTALGVGPGMTTMWMHDGVLDDALVARIEDSLKPRIFTEGGVELLSDAEIDLLQRVMRALVDRDRAALDEIGAYEHESDPYMWARDYGGPGEQVHFVMPPGALADWDVGVMQVDDQPGVSFLVVGMWTREEGHSDLSLEINFYSETAAGSVRGEFINLHVM